MSSSNLSRRLFIKNSIKTGLVAATLPTIIPSSVLGSKANNNINLAVIGLGKQGGGLLRGFLHTPGFHVVALADVDKNKIDRYKTSVEETYAEKLGIGVYKGCDTYQDFRPIMERKDIDAVVIATPDHWHAPMSIMAARAGKDIYCEKPLSLTIGEAKTMVKEVRRNECIFQTGSMQRSMQQFRFAAELVQNGYIGEVKSVRVSIRTGFIPHPVKCDLPAQPTPDWIDWDLWQGPAPNRPYHEVIAPPITDNGWPHWRDYKDYSGGGMTDWGAHHFDIAQWGLGMDNSGPVEIIPADGKDYKDLTYIYENGVKLTCDFEDNGVWFYGTEGEINVNRSHLITTPSSLSTTVLKASDIRLYDSSNHKTDWLTAIQNRTRPICDVAIGARSVTVCHLGNIATELQRKLEWDPQKENFVNDPEAERTIDRAQRSPWKIV